MADRNTAIKSITAALDAMSKIQQEQNKLKILRFQNDQEMQNNFLRSMYNAKLNKEQANAELENKKAFESWKNKPENMSPNDRLAYNAQQNLQKEYDGNLGGSTPVSPVSQPSQVSSQPDMSTQATTPQNESIPSPKVRKVVLGSDGKYKEVYEDNPQYFIWQKQQEEKIKNAPAIEKQNYLVKEQAQDTIDTIAEVRKGMKYFGFLGKVPSEVAPSNIQGEYYERKNWEANIDKLLSGKIITLMNTMKQASKTGATGFGQLNQSELQLLKDASTALNRSLSPEDAKKYIDKIEESAKKVLGTNEKSSNVSSGKIKMTSPDGKIYEVDASEAEEARANGWR